VKAVRRRPRFPDLSKVSGASSQFLVMFLGSSTTEGYRASNENANYVNQFAAKLVESAMDSIAKRQVWVWQRPVPAPGDETIGTGTGWSVTRSSITPYTPGLFFFNGGMSGKNSGSDTNGYYQSGKQQTLVQNLQPDLVIHMIGANDFKDQMSLATYKSNLQFAVSDIRSRTSGKARHLFVHSYQRLDFTPTAGGNTWASYLDVIRQVCNENLDCSYVEITSDFAALGVVPGASYPNAYIQDDGVHATDLGYQKTAEFIVAKTRMTSYRGRVIWGFSADDCGANGTAVASIPPTAALNPLETTPAVQNNASKQPTVVTNALNGHSVLQFDGNASASLSDCLDLALSKSYGFPITVFFVIKQYGAGGATDGSILSRTDSDHYGYAYLFGRYRSGQTLLADLTLLSNEGTNAASNPLAIRTDTPYIVGVVLKAGIASDVYLHALNPIRQTPTAFDATNAPMLTSMRIGSNTGQTNSANMQLAEFRAVQGELTQSEVNAQMQALATKYALTLNTDYTEPVVNTGVPSRPSFDKAVSSGYSSNSGSLSVVVANSNSVVFGAVVGNESSTVSCTLGGVAGTLLGSVKTTGKNYLFLYKWENVNAGTYSLVASFSTSWIAIAASVYYNVSAIGVATTNTGTTASMPSGNATDTTLTAFGGVSALTVTSGTSATTAINDDKAVAMVYSGSNAAAHAATNGQGSVSVKVSGPLVPLPRQRMDKTSGNSLGTSEALITGWTSDANYPSTVTSDGLVVSGSGVAVVTVHASFTNASNVAGQDQLFLYVDGVKVATKDISKLSTAVVEFTWRGNLNNGSVIQLYGKRGSTYIPGLVVADTWIDVCVRNGIYCAGSVAIAGTTLTAAQMPEYDNHDLLIAWAFRDGNNTPPTKPTNWTQLSSVGANTCSALLCNQWPYDNAGSVTVGTFTNATGLIISTYRCVVDPYDINLGTVQVSGGTGTAITHPAINLGDTDGRSLVLRFAGHRTATNLTTSLPGNANAPHGGVASEVALFDTDDGVSANQPATTQTVNASSGWRSAAIEIQAMAT